jgi:purine-nucleoside phosphorylase
MGKGLPEHFAHDRYNIKPDDVTRLILRCEPEQIHEKVIVTPCWHPEEFLADVVDNIKTIAEGNAYETHIYEISYQKQAISLVCSGIGAPQTGDVVLALGCTPCRYLVFTGSFGGLTEDLKIGDLFIITESIGGDGYSSYLAEDELTPNAFLKPAVPDPGLNNLLEKHAAAEAGARGVPLHQGRIFTTDTIVAQYFHLEEMVKKYGCSGIEMETSAVFNGARMTGIAATALLIVSDVIPTGKNLFSGRTQRDQDRYHEIKRNVLGKIILNTLTDSQLK